MAYDLGIDVGTSYTAAAIRDDSGAVTVVGLGPIADSIPTVLYLSEDGSMVAGDAANRRALLDPAGAAREFKRRLGDPTPAILRGAPFSAEALIARMLEHVVDRVVDRQREKPRRVTVSHPANWGPYKMELFTQALRLADLGDAEFITEPGAAALAYAAETRVADGATFAVYDLGGGTFDAAVLRKSGDTFEVLGEPVGLEHLGGMDFDDAVIDHVRSALGTAWPSNPDDPALPAPMSHLRRACMEAKELLSSETQVAVPVLLPGVDASVELTRGELEARIRPAVMDSVFALESAITRSGVAEEDLSAILLVGGSSRIPLVAHHVRERFGDLVAVDVDPVHAVARGAALSAAGVRLSGGMPRATDAATSDTPRAHEPQQPREYEPQREYEQQREPERSVPEPDSNPAAARIRMPAGADTPAREWEPETALPDHRTDPEPAAFGGGSAGGGSEGGNRRLAFLVGVPVLLLVGALAGYALTRGDGDDSNQAGTETQVQGTTQTTVQDDPPAQDDPEVVLTLGPAAADGMVEVSAGTYPLGLDQPESNSSETLSRTVELETFHIDEVEVTNADYKDFVDQAGGEVPASWRAGRYPEALAAHPVQGVSYDWATAYCSAVSKRLPTEAEWEAAARGSDGNVWPWGNDAAAVVLPTSGTYEVGSVTENVSPFGAFDMVGNVWEWVADSYDPRVSDDRRVLRGGQNGFLRETVTRLPVVPGKSSAQRTSGFRCAADEVDSGISPGSFGDYERPAAANMPEMEALPDGVLVFDDFSDATSGWTELTVAGEFRRGYHPNEFLHLETQSEFKEALALGPWKSDPDRGFGLRTSAFVEDRLTEDSGTFSHGLAFKFDETGRGLIFVVDERSSTWALCSREETGEGPFGPVGAAYEVIESSTRSIPAEATLEVVALPDDRYQFKIDGSVVHTRTIPGFDGTATGLVLLSYADSEQVHIHFDEFQVNDLG